MTLQKMARDLSIPPHHLSQVLNTKLNNNFYNFINSYRVNEAKKLLKSTEHRDTRILEISHMAGFKSKSVFNAVFKEFTNLTPKEFRDGNGVQ
jgi:AraC-like DNA-binding protein